MPPAAATESYCRLITDMVNLQVYIYSNACSRLPTGRSNKASGLYLENTHIRWETSITKVADEYSEESRRLIADIARLSVSRHSGTSCRAPISWVLQQHQQQLRNSWARSDLSVTTGRVTWAKSNRAVESAVIHRWPLPCTLPVHQLSDVHNHAFTIVTAQRQLSSRKRPIFHSTLMSCHTKSLLCISPPGCNVTSSFVFDFELTFNLFCYLLKS